MPEEAERLAVEEMGDPMATGLELDRIHRPKPQWGLLLWAAALAFAGAFLRVWLIAGVDTRYVIFQPEKVVFSLVVGCACMVGMYLLDYTFLLKHAVFLTLCGVLLSPA